MILVVGGAGYIGSHVVKDLLEKGEKVIVLDDLSTGHEWAVPKSVQFYKANISDASALDKLFSDHHIDVVMHFAASCYVGESMRNPSKYFHNNVVNFITLLEAMRTHDVKKIVYSSSCSIYGIPDTVPVSESAPKNPESPYGESKLMAENLMQWYHVYGLKSVVLRYFNAAGASPDGSLGELHDPETHLIPLVFDVALRKREKLMIYGDDYRTEDGTCVRDYVHVTDLSAAHLLALDLFEKIDDMLYLNVGSGKGHSVREVIAMCEEVAGKKIPVEIGKRRQGDPPRLWSDTNKIDFLGWAPKHSDLFTIVKTAWVWHQKKI